MPQIQNVEFKKALTTQTGTDTGITQNGEKKTSAQSIFTGQKTTNATPAKASAADEKRPIDPKATKPAPQGSVAWAAVKGFFSGAKEGVSEYYSEKFDYDFDPDKSFGETAWEGAKRTMSLVDDGWEHIKAPIREWAAKKDQEIFDDDENLNLKERLWIGAKAIGSMGDELTTGTGICTWAAFAGGGKAAALGWRDGKAALAAKAAKTTKTITSKGNAITKAAKQYLAEHPKISNTLRTSSAIATSTALPAAPIGLIAFGNEEGIEFGSQMIANAGAPIVGIPLAKGGKAAIKAMMK